MRRLPLRQLPWKHPVRDATNPRLITLDLDVKRFSPDMFPKMSPGVAHNTFFLHVFLVGCDDVEQYRSSTRKQIQDWLNIIMAKKGQEWVICHVAPSDTKTKLGGLFQLGSTQTVFDKLKTDFNQQKRCNLIT